MLEINLGYTAPINRPGQSILTLNQVWQGLQRKVTHAHEFVPIIINCEVLSDEQSTSNNSANRTVTRRVTFRPSTGPMHTDTVREECVLHAPCRVDFRQEDGTKIANYVTYGPSGEESDLFMTYVFQWLMPGVEEGSEEAGRLRARYKETAKMAVESSIETIRRMAADGTI